VVVVALELGPDRFVALEEEHRPHDQVAEVDAPRGGLEFLVARVDLGNLFSFSAASMAAGSVAAARMA
jgi:hypothetical protein